MFFKNFSFECSKYFFVAFLKKYFLSLFSFVQVSLHQGLKKTIDYFHKELLRSSHSNRNMFQPEASHDKTILNEIVSKSVLND